MATFPIPGIRREYIRPAPAPALLQTGVCGFVGACAKGQDAPPTALNRAEAFQEAFGASDGGCLADAVAGFFANGGRRCYVVHAAVGDAAALNDALAALAKIEEVDLVCAPDIMFAPNDKRLALQRQLLEHCEHAGNRMAILDPPPNVSAREIIAWRTEQAGYDTRLGALYYPWIGVGQQRFIPPCGHVAGVYARTDREAGFYAAPANRAIEGALDLAQPITQAELGELNDNGINCLLALPGRGIRIWGAHTLASRRNIGWEQVNISRLFLTVGRWIERRLDSLAFEPNDLRLWIRVRRELTAYLYDLWRAGGLQGQRPEAAFYIKCDATTNPPEVHAAGMLVAEIGLAAIVPAEFIVLRFVQRDGRTAVG